MTHEEEFEKMCEALRSDNPAALMPSEVAFDVGMLIGYIQVDARRNKPGAQKVIDSLKSAWVKTLLDSEFKGS